MQKLAPALGILSALLCPSGAAQTLNILTWEAYFSDAVLAEWEARSGMKINQIYFDKDEVRNTILFSSDSTRIDLVTVDPTTTEVIGERDFFVPLSHYADTPNLVHNDPMWVERCGSYSVPYTWGTLGLVYRKDRFSTPPHSWQALLQPSQELYGHIGFVENYIDTLVPSLITRGVPVTTDDEAILREVFEEMRALVPAILTFDYAISYLANSPRADDLSLALAYSGDEKTLNELSSSDQWGFVVPDEGSMIWGECLGILAQSPHLAEAMDFINFLNTPAIAARNSEEVGVATTNLAAVALQSEAFRANTALYPRGELMAKLHHYSLDISVQNIMLRDRITSTLVELNDSQ